jgi:hypothetical protein
MPDQPDNSWQSRVLAELEKDGPYVQIAEGAKVYVVNSRSDPMAFHYLIDIGWIVLCTCRGFRFRTECRHVRDYWENGFEGLTPVPSP